MDVLIVRKLGVPTQPELGMGAVAEGGHVVLNVGIARQQGVDGTSYGLVLARELAELHRRIRRYRHGAPLTDVRGRKVILVDDGVATGVTDLAAVGRLRDLGAGTITLAVPVGPPDTIEEFTSEADLVVCLQQPSRFGSVGWWYEDFSPTLDAEVTTLLGAHAEIDRPEPVVGERTVFAVRTVAIPWRDDALMADLRVPGNATGLVVFAHGTGSDRRSPRNVAVAEGLAERGFATLLVDLWPEGDPDAASHPFDGDLLAERFEHAVRWIASEPDVLGLPPLGLFGASTGAAVAAAHCGRAGRPHRASGGVAWRETRSRPRRRGAVGAPTLLVAGANDGPVLALNRAALASLRGPHRLAVVSGAGHLFEEPGALAALQGLTVDWFSRHLVAEARSVRGRFTPGRARV